MPAYRPEEIEKKWQAHWKAHSTFKAENHSEKPKYYVLDMFPYPSGAGLHVGHPLGYIASDIVTRYKRLQGFNVLHPMGFDSFGLPAEQYAIQTGQHPEKTTRENIARYIEQLSALGFSYDWSREVRTSDAGYYKWTQWIFLKLFNSWYNLDTNQAEPIGTLLAKRASVHATGLRGRPATGHGGKAEIIEAVLRDVWPDVERGTIRPIVDRRLPMSRAAEAHTVVEASEHVGKVLLLPAD